ncbi:MAG TPA: hypothetical protein VLL76_07600, partial [Candidatus Omnitrophota bacterium]|nr:hypothetical protein [Candidatus Omnitrophota bacterium]
LAFAASTHPGSAENYYFAAAFLALVATVAALRSGAFPSLAAIWAAAWLAQAGLLAYALTPGGAIKNLDGVHASLTTMDSCLQPVPKPMLVADQYLSLPWMRAGAEPLASSYGYAPGRAAGLAFEGGGVGGLIEAGRFAALALPEPADPFDGGRLFRYERTPLACGHLRVFLRKDLAAPPSAVPALSP